ncbi:hypothetical protein SAMN05443253_1315 [Bacillus sp. OK048]|nr:hypothetical protein SAMN05443253_1315 [Bacillus sp. OK048]
MGLQSVNHGKNYGDRHRPWTVLLARLDDVDRGCPFFLYYLGFEIIYIEVRIGGYLIKLLGLHHVSILTG